MKTRSEIWFEKLKDIWFRKAPAEIADLVATKFEYYEDPFEEPITDVSELTSVWNEIKDQSIEKIEIVPLVCRENSGTARYHFVATIDGKPHESKGSYFLRIDDEGRAIEFRQWWNVK